MEEKVNKPELLVDAEFAALIPALSAEESAGLESSIKAEGCRDSLVVWRTDGKDILLDGHNRYEICSSVARDFNTKLRLS